MQASLIFAMLLPLAGPDPTPQPLWTANVPAVVGDPEANRPTLTAYLPAADKAVGTAVIVCPGGGYGAVMIDHEGKQVADWLTARGVVAFVLQYRVVSGKRPAPLHPAPLLDIQRAIRTVRANAARFGVKPDRIGVCGFSAGGHLASSAATHFDAGKPDAADPIDRASCRPDFVILGYPVISMDPNVTHRGSRKNLLGPDPTDDLVKLMSNDMQVTKETPPAFIFHTDDDGPVPVTNSLLYYLACKKHGVSVEMHSYANGPHGVGLAQKDPVLRTWPERLEAWMAGRGLLGQ